MAACHGVFSVWLFGHGFGEEFPEVDADFKVFVFGFGFEDSACVSAVFDCSSALFRYSISFLMSVCG